MNQINLIFFTQFYKHYPFTNIIFRYQMLLKKVKRLFDQVNKPTILLFIILLNWALIEFLKIC